MKCVTNELTIMSNAKCLPLLGENEKPTTKHALKAQEIPEDINISREKLEITTSIREALEVRTKVYSPLEKTTEKINTTTKLTSVATYLLYADDLVTAFTEDTTTFDKISTVCYIVPYIGPLLGILNSASKGDWTNVAIQGGILGALAVVPELEPVVVIVMVAIEVKNEVDNVVSFQEGMEEYVAEQHKCWDIICNQGIVYWSNNINDPINETILQVSQSIRSQVAILEADLNYKTTQLLESKDFTESERKEIINIYHKKVSTIRATGNESIEKFKTSLFDISIQAFYDMVLPAIQEKMDAQTARIIEAAREFTYIHEHNTIFPLWELAIEASYLVTEGMLNKKFNFDPSKLPKEQYLIKEELVTPIPFRLSDDKYLLDLSYMDDSYQDVSGNQTTITIMGNVEKHYGKDDDLGDSSYFSNTAKQQPTISLKNIIEEKMDRDNVAKWKVTDNGGTFNFNDDSEFYMHNKIRISREIILEPNSNYLISFSSRVDNNYSPLKFNIIDNSTGRIIATSIITHRAYIKTSIDFITLSSKSYTLEFIHSPQKEINEEDDAKAWIQNIKIDKRFMDTDNGYISVTGDTHIGDESSFTVAFWLKHINLSNNETILTSNMSWEGGSPGWGIGYKANEIIIKICDIHNGVTTFSFKDNTFFDTMMKEWNHIAVSFSLGSVIKLFINGFKMKEFNITDYENIDSEHEVVIGGDGTKSVLNKTNFAIQNFVIVKEELTNFDILMLYTDSSTRNLNFQREVTYNQLQILIYEKKLEPGIQYLLSNYKTKYKQPYTNVIKESDYVERLILTATSRNTLAPTASSLDFPDDIIYYDFNKNLCEDNKTPRNGYIIRRIDVDNNIDMGFDWRNMLWPRFKATAIAWDGDIVHEGSIRQVGNELYLAIAPGIPSDIKDGTFFHYLCETDDYFFTDDTNGNWSQWPNGLQINKDNYAQRYTFNASTNMKLKEPTSSRQIIPRNVVIKTLPGDYCANNVFMYNTEKSKPVNISLERSCNNNTFGNNCNNITFGYNCFNNFLSDNCMNTTFDSGCSNNIFRTDCSNNKLGNNSSHNYFKLKSSHNVTGSNFKYNLLGERSYNNIFGNNCVSSHYGDDCNGNSVIHCSLSAIGNNFSKNIIQSAEQLDLRYKEIYKQDCTYTIFLAGGEYVATYYDLANINYQYLVKLS